jgi:uracil-DNA glycosylase
MYFAYDQKIDPASFPSPSSDTSKMSLKRKAGEIATEATKKPKQNASITSFFGVPKPNPSTSKPSSDPTAPATQPIKFDKDAWVASLSDEHKKLLKLEIDTLHESWLGALKDEVTSESFLNLKRFLQKESEGSVKIFPPLEDVYSWYEACVISAVA